MNLSQMNVVTDATAAAAAAVLLVIRFICMRVGYDGIIIIVIGRTDERRRRKSNTAFIREERLFMAGQWSHM